MEELRVLYVARKITDRVGAGMAAFQVYGMVNAHGAFDEADAKAKLAAFGVPGPQFRALLTLLQNLCKLNPPIKKGRGASYWEKFTRCMLEQADKLP
ncbi:hypothetical protein ACFQ08_05685 [Streptosporangium algeriense]|uniref:Uncharacterized protein n=1 Tax=Streptosporangium algeriense TaxID=1682748 RepID=A0ABW3DMT2_9ACTN